ncbi:MAG: hypothetical protein E7672_06250 [Ruminococcaceae bacterium]|nr:hypothetical protein [Oscillospiraceae bacterium]
MNNRPSNRPPSQNDPRRQQNPADREARLRQQQRIRQEEARRQAQIEYDRQMQLRKKQREKARRKQQRKEDMKVFGGRFLVFFIVLLILLVIAGVLFVMVFYRTPDAPPDSGNMKYYYGGEEVRSEKIDDCISNGTVYVCFNDLADYIDMSESGSVSTGMTFILKGESSDTAEGNGSEEMILFHIDGYTVEINGQQVTLDIPNLFRGGNVWVSSKFVKDYMSNLSYSYNGDDIVKISRIKDEENSTSDHIAYLDVSFKLKESYPLDPIPEDPLVGDDPSTNPGDNVEEPYDFGFKTDLSAYEDYMNPTGDKRDSFLILVNTKNHLDANYVPDDLTDVKYTEESRNTQQLRLYAAKALEAMYKELYANEFYNMAVHSGFRTYSYQDFLFRTYTNNEMAANPSLTKEQAEAIVLTYSTRPGTSEHQSGLAVDMDTYGTFTTDFAYTAEYAWLQENAWKFGFILRFPEDKTHITTIQFEPWHYRYVGRYHAKKIYDSGLCLEEYIGYLNGN